MNRTIQNRRLMMMGLPEDLKIEEQMSPVFFINCLWLQVLSDSTGDRKNTALSLPLE